MRLLLLILFLGSVLTDDEPLTKIDDKKTDDVKEIKEAKKSIEEPKSKTEKRDSSDQTGTYILNPNDEPFKPIIPSIPVSYEVAASDTQEVYYDKNQLTSDESANTKGTINRQAAANVNNYRPPYSQEVYQQQPQQQYQQQQLQQQHQNKNHLKIVGKNAGIQQQNQQTSILYAVPHNAPYNYERIPQQQQQSLQHQPEQRGPRKQSQYVIAIPLSYLRQLQQQLVYQQQDESASSPAHLQVQKGQLQQPTQQQQQQQQQPVFSIVGPLARDHHGAYRPFHHRYSPTAVNDVSTNVNSQQQQHHHHHQQQPAAQSSSAPLIPASPAPPGYITQYIQIPASVLLAAAQSAQTQQRPYNIQHQAVLQQQAPHQQHTQNQSPQVSYYYQPQLQQSQQQHYQLQQQQQLKQSQTSHTLTAHPLYEYHVQQQPIQQQQTAVQHIAEYQQQQQQPLNVGKQQQHRFEGVRPNAPNLTPSQHGIATAYGHEQAQLAAIHAQAHAPAHLNSLTHAHNQQHQQPSQELTAPQAPQGHKLGQAITPTPAPPASESYEPVVHYNPQYIQHYQQQLQLQQQQQQQQHQQIKYQQFQHPQYRLQVQHPHPHSHQQQQTEPSSPALVDNFNYLPYSQAMHGPSPVPFLRLPSAGATMGVGAGVTPHSHLSPQPAQMTPYYNYNLVAPAIHHQPFITSALQPSYAPLGMPSKVTSFTNVLLQPFTGHPSSYQTPEIGNVAAANANALPFFNHNTGGIHYGSHLYHPATPATAISSDKQHNPDSGHASPRAATSAGKTKTSSAKVSGTAGSQTIVKYP